MPSAARASAGAATAIVGGRTHVDKGNPAEVDDELSMAGLDRVVAYDPEEMLAVVEAGIRVGALGGYWPTEGRSGRRTRPTRRRSGGVRGGGVLPAPTRMGPLRDTVVELELVTGDGRLVRSGARTVKSVQGYDLHRLATGSLGSLGAIVQVAVKVRPLPKARRLVARRALACRQGARCSSGPAPLRGCGNARWGRGRPRRMARGDRGTDGGDPERRRRRGASRGRDGPRAGGDRRAGRRGGRGRAVEARGRPRRGGRLASVDGRRDGVGRAAG